jgi:hypothetical protein
MSKTPECQISSVVLAMLRAAEHTNAQFGTTKLTVCLQICASKSQKTIIKRKTCTTVFVQNYLRFGVSCMITVLYDTCLV